MRSGRVATGLAPGTASITAGVFLVALVAAAGAAIPVVGIAVLAAVAGGMVWMRAAAVSSPVLAAGLLVSSAGLLVPQAASAGAEAVLLGLAVWLTLAAVLMGDRRWIVAAACLAVPVVWAGLALNPNVPTASLALLGIRKSTLVFVALAVGAVWAKQERERLAGFVVGCLAAGGLASFTVHLLLPGVEAALPRHAGAYTALFQGQLRMQGIYAGPFHVSLLGAFLALRGWHGVLASERPRWRPLALLAIALPLLGLSEVRTGFVTVGLGLLVTVLVRPPRAPGQRALSALAARARVLAATATLGVVLVLALGSGLSSDRALSSIPQLSQDTRATSRLGAWSDSLRLVSRSPLIGWGPGSAGATLGDQFFLRQHVTPHNAVLVVAVEGGLVGGIAVAVALALVVALSPGLLDITNPASAAVLALIGFGLTGGVSEALPISLLLALLVGLRVGSAGARGT